MTHLFAKLNPFAITIIAIIMAVLLISIISSIRIKSRYKKLAHEMKRIKEGEELSHGLIPNIINEYKNSASDNVEQVNTQAIIEKNFSLGLSKTYLSERFVKGSVSLMIILGLLGTFYGLTLSIGKLVELLSDSSNVEMLNSMDSIVQGLINSVKGMSVAFITSLFGIGSAIVMTILKIVYDIDGVKLSVMVDIEEYLDNVVAKEFVSQKEGKLNYISEKMTKSIEGLSENIKEMMDSYNNNVVDTTKAIESASLTLYKTTEKFDNSIEKFVENTRDFSEFNYNLRTNIERMNVTFADFTEDMKVNMKRMKENKPSYSQVAASLDKTNNTKNR